MLEYEKARLKLAHYWFKTLGRWRSCPFICPVVRPHHRHVFWSWFGSFLAIFITSYLTVKSFPDSPLAQPRNVIGGNLLGALVSLIFLHFLGSSPVTMAMAVSTSIVLMQLTGTVHPASGGIALVVMMTKPDWQFLLTPTLEGSIILVLCAVIFNNLAQERIYPKYWL